MKIIIFVLIVFLSINTSSAEPIEESWRVHYIDKHFYLIKQEQKFKIDFDVGTPKFVREEQLNKRFKAVIYFSGDVGTSTLISIHRCLLFDGDEYLANVPYSYGYKGSEDFLGPTWNISEDKIEIIDDESGRKWSFQ